MAAELRSPLESISQLTESVMTGDASTAWNDLGTIAEEAHKASEIVSRLVSLVQPERTEAKRVELNSLLRSLIQFRTLEWEARGFEVQDELCPTPVYVLGSQGQLERVFLDLLIQAEQSLAEASEKRLTIGSSVLARRALVEIRYGVNPLKGVRESEPSRESVAGVAGEGVSRGIVRSHGGEMRLVRVGEGECKLELELPVAPALLAGEAAGHGPSPAWWWNPMPPSARNWSGCSPIAGAASFLAKEPKKATSWPSACVSTWCSARPNCPA